MCGRGRGNSIETDQRLPRAGTFPLDRSRRPMSTRIVILCANSCARRSQTISQSSLQLQKQERSTRRLTAAKCTPDLLIYKTQIRIDEKAPTAASLSSVEIVFF